MSRSKAGGYICIGHKRSHVAMNTQCLPVLTPNRWIEQKSVGWPKAIAAIALILFGLPIVVAIFEGVGDLIFVHGNWRNLFLQPSIILYAIIVSKPMLRTRSTVAQALRPVLTMDDDTFDEVVNNAARPIPHGELVGFMIGLVFSFSVNGSFVVQEDAFWTSLYSYSSTILMWGVVGWMVYGAIYVTQFTTRLLHQPLDIDIFDISPFVPIGRQGLLLALIFVGSITVSLIIVLEPGIHFTFRIWAIYLVLTFITILIFFLNMWPAHRILATARSASYDQVESRLQCALALMNDHLAAGEENIQEIGSEINALATYGERVELVKTWPYNTEMLRTLFLSVLTPVLIGLSRVIGMLVVDRLFAR